MRPLKYSREPTETVELCWQVPDALRIQASNAIYFFRRKRGRGILYIGKAGRQTVKGRLFCRSKDRLRELAKRDGGEVRPFVAALFTKRPVTRKLVDDVERLLIFLVDPPWNRPGKLTCRLHHRELVVKCTGEWPHPRTTFSYCDDFPFSLSYKSE
jgi:hypothetical protein